MTRTLNVSADLRLPLEWMTLATVVYGARGSGKTSLGAVLAEEVTAAKQRFCAIDLKGDWYGLKSTADGTGEGIPVVVFGGDHADVPLEDGAGAFIGETVAGLDQSCILDLEQFSKGKQVRLLAAFFEALYDRNREPLLLLLDEAQRYAPQKPIDPDAARCLGATEDLVKLGRKHGIGPVLFTQRGSGLNKEVSELCDLMVAFRTPGPLDQDRIKDWLDANTTKAQREQVMGQLAGLATGTAVFASGHPDLKIFGAHQVRRRETFDSSATPKVGQRRKEPKRLATPDLETLRIRMAAAIERQKADDPKELRRQLAEVRTELARVRNSPQPVGKIAQPVRKTERVEVPILTDVQIKRLERVMTALQTATGRAEALHSEAVAVAKDMNAAIRERIRAAAPEAPLPPFTMTVRGPGVAYVPPARPAGPPAVGLTGPQQAILDTVAMLNVRGIPADRDAVARWLGIHPKGGSYGTNLGLLRAQGYIEGFVLTTPGKVAARAQDTGLEAALAALDGEPKRQIIRTLVESGKPISREQLADKLGLHPKGGSYGTNLGWLRTMGIITERGPIAATEGLYR